MAETFTDKLKLTKRDTGDLNWGAGHNANLDLVDAHAQQATLRPPRTLLATLGSGGVGSELLGNTTYFYRVTAVNEAGETTENKIPTVVVAQVSQPASPLPVILQWETVKGATAYRIYKSDTAGQEKFLVEVSGESTSTYTDTGNTPTNVLVSVPAQNTARTSVRKIIGGSGISVTPPDGTGDVTIQASGISGVSSLKKTGEATSLTGDVSLEQGLGIQITQDDPNDKIVIANGGVTGLRKEGEASPVTGDVKLEGTGGITLIQDQPNNKIQINFGGGGASGYASAVVGAATGVAATDTGNIQAALNSVGSLGGGIVILREGTYNINATLNIPAKVTLAGQGRHATILLGDPSFGASNMVNAGGANIGLRDLTVDENFPNRTANSGYACLLNASRPLVENIQIIRNRATNGMIFLSDGQMRNCIIINDGNPLGTAIVQGGDLIDSCSLFQSQNGNVNDFMQGPNQVVNCRLLRNQGTVSGAGIRASTSNKIIIGNGIFVGGGNNAIIIGGSAGTYIGNICQGGNIRLDPGAGANTIIGNAMAVIVDNSGQSNQIANNT